MYEDLYNQMYAEVRCRNPSFVAPKIRPKYFKDLGYYVNVFRGTHRQVEPRPAWIIVRNGNYNVFYDFEYCNDPMMSLTAANDWLIRTFSVHDDSETNYGNMEPTVLPVCVIL